MPQNTGESSKNETDMILYCGQLYQWTILLMLMATEDFAIDNAPGLNTTPTTGVNASTPAVTATNITSPVKRSNKTVSVIEPNTTTPVKDSNGRSIDNLSTTPPTPVISTITPKRTPANNGSWVTWQAWECLGCHKTRYRGCRLPADAKPYLLSCNTVDFEQIEDIAFCCRRPTRNVTKFAELELKEEGGWSHWKEWHCSENCTEKKMVQTRECDNPAPKKRGGSCDGISVRHKYNSQCQLICPQECPMGKWGVNCVNSCVNCVLDCDKLTGKCGNCIAGYQYPHMSCNKACGSNTYGSECQGNCLEKCEGSDCVERTLGICPPHRTPLFWMWTLTPVIIIPITVLIIIRYRKNTEIDERMVIDRIAKVLSSTENARGSLTQWDNRPLSKPASKRYMLRKQQSMNSYYDRISRQGSSVD